MFDNHYSYSHQGSCDTELRTNKHTCDSKTAYFNSLMGEVSLAADISELLHDTDSFSTAIAEPSVDMFTCSLSSVTTAQSGSATRNVDMFSASTSSVATILDGAVVVESGPATHKVDMLSASTSSVATILDGAVVVESGSAARKVDTLSASSSSVATNLDGAVIVEVPSSIVASSPWSISPKEAMPRKQLHRLTDRLGIDAELLQKLLPSMGFDLITVTGIAVPHPGRAVACDDSDTAQHLRNLDAVLCREGMPLLTAAVLREGRVSRRRGELASLSVAHPPSLNGNGPGPLPIDGISQYKTFCCLSGLFIFLNEIILETPPHLSASDRRTDGPVPKTNEANETRDSNIYLFMFVFIYSLIYLYVYMFFDIYIYIYIYNIYIYIYRERDKYFYEYKYKCTYIHISIHIYIYI